MRCSFPSWLSRPLRLATALALVWLAGGCTVEGGGPALKGDVPLQPLEVGHVSLPEVDASGASRPFVTRARPGGLLLVFFGFVSCPDICPTTLSDVKRALRAIGPSAERVEVAFITVDPVRDSAAVLAPYLASFFERGGHALRPATQADLAQAQRAFQATSTITRQADGHVDVSHTAATSVVDEAGRVRVTWPFGTSSADMAHDLRMLVAEVSRAGAAAPAAAAPVEVTGAWLRESPAGASMGAGYLTLRSGGGDALASVAVADSVAAAAEIHEVVADASGAMGMRRVASVTLPAGEAVELRPGGHHIMLLGLRRPLRGGDAVELRLRFERAGEQRVTAVVRPS